MNSACFLAFLTLFVGWADSFSWDIVVSEAKSLKFYDNGTLTHTEDIPSAMEIYAITYDPVHNRVLFADNHHANHQISSFDLSTRNTQPLVSGKPGDYMFVAYDPVTQLLFWLSGYKSIYSFSLNPASSNDRNLIVQLDSNNYSYDIAVDSCGGYIYWITAKKIERVRFDGSEREVLIDTVAWMRLSLAIDQQTQRIYWIERMEFDDYISIESADLNGNNRRILYTTEIKTKAGSLTVSNDFIYWNSIYDQKAIWQLPKNHPLEAKLFSTSKNNDWDFQVIAAKYTIKEQLKGNPNCETLKSLISKESEPDCKDAMLCVHGTKVSGDSRCECKKGYSGKRCDISVCQDYCLQGNCSVSAEGQPKCSCKAGYSGERCQVNACHEYCLNNGICSLNEDHDPVCQCTIGYDGERCDVPAVVVKCIQTVTMLRDLLKADLPPVTLSKGVQSTCASTVL